MRCMLSALFLITFAVAVYSTSASASNESRAFSYEVCRDWYEDRYYDWDQPAVPSNSRKHYNTLCLHFHKTMLTELYGSPQEAPALISGGLKEICNGLYRDVPSFMSPEQHEAMKKKCVVETLMDQQLHQYCISRGHSAHEKEPYVRCRSKLQFEQENGWRPFADVHRSAEMYVNERSVNSIYVIRWFEKVEKLNPHLLCPRDAAWSLFEQCKMKLASPPYPIEVDER